MAYDSTFNAEACGFLRIYFGSRYQVSFLEWLCRGRLGHCRSRPFSDRQVVWVLTLVTPASSVIASATGRESLARRFGSGACLVIVQCLCHTPVRIFRSRSTLPFAVY